MFGTIGDCRVLYPEFSPLFQGGGGENDFGESLSSALNSNDTLCGETYQKVKAIQNQFSGKMKGLLKQYNCANPLQLKKSYPEVYQQFEKKYIEALQQFESKKEETCKKFEELGIDIKPKDFSYIVMRGVTKDNNYFYADWDQEKLGILINCGMIDKQHFDFQYICRNYDAVNNFDKDKLSKVYEKGLKLTISALKEFNEIEILDQRLQKLSDLLNDRVLDEIVIDDPEILTEKYFMNIPLLKKCFQGEVCAKEGRFLTCSEKELNQMEEYHEKLGITFYKKTDEEFLSCKIDVNNLKKIKDWFLAEIDESGVKKFDKVEFNIEKFKNFKNLLDENHLAFYMNTDRIAELQKLENEDFKRLCENLLMFKKDLGYTGDYRNLPTDFLVNFNKESSLDGIKLYSVLSTLYATGAFLPFDLAGLQGNTDYYRSMVRALLSDRLLDDGINFDDPDDIKNNLLINRRAIDEFQKMGIKIGLEFFVKPTWWERDPDKENINIDNIKIIHNKYPLNKVYDTLVSKNLDKSGVYWNNLIEDIARGYLGIKNVTRILSSCFPDKTYNEITNDLEKYRKPDIEGTDYCSLAKALEIMNKCVKDHSQGEPSKE